MLDQMSLWDIPNVISSQELECGATHCDSLEFPTIHRSGPEAAHAKVLVWPAKGAAKTMIGIYGRCGLSSSRHVSQKLFSASKSVRP